MLSRFARVLSLCLAGEMTPIAAGADPVAAFHAWVDTQGAGTTAIAVVREGDVIAGDNSDRPFDLASNSKVITALCIAALVDEGALDWDTPLSDALGAPAPEATLAELVTHTSGIAPDGTQLRMGLWLNEATPRHAHVARIVLDRRQQRGTRGSFQYNNENYALLGRIVERATGTTYAEACRARVLAPAGVEGRLSPRFAAFAAWGGWRMTMADHARLIAHWFGPGRTIGADPLAHPHAERGGDAFYGLGMNYVRLGTGLRMSHAGAISIPFGPKTGAFVVHYPDGTVAATAYDVAVARPEQFRRLEHALSKALALSPADTQAAQ
jgi:CubicO group peptidase (beta-lactamase class C family)